MAQRFFIDDNLDLEYRFTHDQILDLRVLLARAKEQNNQEDIDFFGASLARREQRWAEMEVLREKGGY